MRQSESSKKLGSFCTPSHQFLSINSSSLLRNAPVDCRVHPP
jgi:hypothetical protein